MVPGAIAAEGGAVVGRWLATKRWHLLAFTVAMVCLRIAAGLIFAFPYDGPAWPVRTTVTIVSNVVMCGGIVATITAFVQYGRIFNPRIPTE